MRDIGRDGSGLVWMISPKNFATREFNPAEINHRSSNDESI